MTFMSYHFEVSYLLYFLSNENMIFSYDHLVIGYPWNATYVTDYDYDGMTFLSDVIVNFTTDGSINYWGFLIQFYSGN